MPSFPSHDARIGKFLTLAVYGHVLLGALMLGTAMRLSPIKRRQSIAALVMGNLHLALILAWMVWARLLRHGLLEGRIGHIPVLIETGALVALVADVGVGIWCVAGKENQYEGFRGPAIIALAVIWGVVLLLTFIHAIIDLLVRLARLVSAAYQRLWDLGTGIGSGLDAATTVV